MGSEITTDKTFAAIDLGSNSFHMAVAGATSTHLQMIDKLRQPVRLGSGLDKGNNITPETMDRALSCLQLFQHRLRGVPTSQIRAVGTNTLRRARNANDFNQQAESILGTPIDIISGREEARLIYTGVVYGRHDDKKRLVIDIGGGSTELIVGTGIKPVIMESVNMGCVEETRKLLTKKGIAALSAISSISDDRKAVILGGLAVLIATFRSLNIEFMNVSHSALREGVIVDLAGKVLNEHVRHDAIADIQRRFQIDRDQANKVHATADTIFDSVCRAWALDDKQHRPALHYACALHEIGLSVAHVQYHKHGDYLLTHADMLGFSRNDQNMLAGLVRNHRRKVATGIVNRLSASHKEKYYYLLVILRLAVLFHRTRTASVAPPLTISVTTSSLIITLPDQWLSENPLTYADLLNEIDPARAAGITLAIHATSR